MMKTSLIALLSLALTGCSFAFTRPPPYKVKARVPPQCSGSMGMPLVDVAAGAGSLAFGGWIIVNAATGNVSPRDSAPVVGAFGGLFVLAAAAWGASAYSGFRNVPPCQAATHEWKMNRNDLMVSECVEASADTERRAREWLARATKCDPDAAIVACHSCAKMPLEHPPCTATLCLREIECGRLGCEETHRSKELQVAVDRLALETTCPRPSIELMEQAEWRAGTETAFRLGACGPEYVCTVAAGRVSCKAAMVAPPPAAPAE